MVLINNRDNFSINFVRNLFMYHWVYSKQRKQATILMIELMAVSWFWVHYELLRVVVIFWSFFSWFYLQVGGICFYSILMRLWVQHFLWAENWQYYSIYFHTDWVCFWGVIFVVSFSNVTNKLTTVMMGWLSMWMCRGWMVTGCYEDGW